MSQFLFPLCLFLSASLLFIIQPMVAKVLLPVYGGTPAVWTVCMLFFQLLLLVAYAYAWVLSKFKGAQSWRVVHLFVCFLSLCVLPVSFLPIDGGGNPEASILKNLLIQLGFPLLVVGASAPLLQYAFSQTKRKRAADPYFLYVASNVGSLLALLSYPWLVERFVGIHQQFYNWNIIYLVYLLILLFLLFTIRYEEPENLTITNSKIAWPRLSLWVFLSFVPCSLMLGVTFYISTDVAATPLFWVLPLALYLLSFVVTFESKPLISHAWVVRNTLIFLLFPIISFIFGIQQISAVQIIIAHLLGFFMLALLCHGELVRIRPEARQLTTFYFCLALGGVLAGIFNGLVAPRLFAHAYEYPLALLLGLLCIPIKSSSRLQEWLMPAGILALLLLNFVLPDVSWVLWLKKNHGIEVLALTLIMVWPGSRYSLFFGMLILFIFLLHPLFQPTQVLSQQRNFYGIKQVFSKQGTHVLLSQSTLHGFQLPLGEKLTQDDGTRAYYGPVFPVIQELQVLHEPLRTMIIGLGTGIMACQFRQEDKLTIIEIDEQVINIARNPNLFTYLRDCPPQSSLIKDDGRLAISKAADSSYELLVMDAFSSDAIPIHLLTLEAFSLYKKKLTEEGVILVNLSNRHLRVLPVLTGAARELEMIILHKKDAGNNSLGQLPSEWALLTSNDHLANHLLGKEGWRFVADAKTELWTNDYSNIIPLLKW